MKHLEEKERERKKERREGRRERSHLSTGKGEASLPRSFLNDHQGALPAVSTARENDHVQQTKTYNRQITKTIHLNWGTLCQKSLRKSCQHSSYRRCERQWEWSPSCRRSASYLWSLLWPSDYRDPSDGQTGVIIRMLLQDILWPNKGAILAQNRGEVPEGDPCNIPLPKKFLKCKSHTSLWLPWMYHSLIIFMIPNVCLERHGLSRTQSHSILTKYPYQGQGTRVLECTQSQLHMQRNKKQNQPRGLDTCETSFLPSASKPCVF